MSERYDESDLLAWLEDELDPAPREALESALAADPAVMGVLRRMREDRELLRTAGQPELPRDLVAELELQLARPMLIEHEPGQYRRDLRDRTRRRRLSPVRLALAAVVLLAVIAGVWAVAVGLPGWTGRIGPMAPDGFASADPDGTPGAEGALPSIPGAALGLAPDGLARTAAGPAAPDPGTIVHHRRPLPAGPDAAGASLAAGGTSPSLDRTPVPARFALVIQAGDGDAIGETVAEVVQGWLDVEAGPQTVALVRNFSFDEANQLLAELRRDPRRSGSVPDALTDVSGGSRNRASAAERRRRMADLLRGLERGGSASTPARPESGRLAGPTDLEPSYERQLEFSSAGAAYTITVPAARLNELLARLRSIDGMTTRLRAMGDGNETTAGATGLQRWVEEHRTVQALVADGAEGYLLLPVIVEADDP